MGCKGAAWEVGWQGNGTHTSIIAMVVFKAAMAQCKARMTMQAPSKLTHCRQ